MKSLTTLLVVALAAASLAGMALAGGTSSGRSVVINGESLDDATLAALEGTYGVVIQDARYWYDPVCGAWGFEGGPGVGLILPGLDLGGPLTADASNGDTGVFVNGRELHQLDVMALMPLVGPVVPGRYWLDAWGNVGLEGGPALVNLVQLAQAQYGQGGGGGGSSLYRSDITGHGAGSSGGTSYVMGKDWSVTVGP